MIDYTYILIWFWGIWEVIKLSRVLYMKAILTGNSSWDWVLKSFVLSCTIPTFNDYWKEFFGKHIRDWKKKPFPKMFSTFLKQYFNFAATVTFLSANGFNLSQSRVLLFGKGLGMYQSRIFLFGKGLRLNQSNIFLFEKGLHLNQSRNFLFPSC